MAGRPAQPTWGGWIEASCAVDLLLGGPRTGRPRTRGPRRAPRTTRCELRRYGRAAGRTRSGRIPRLGIHLSVYQRPHLVVL